jgi:basic amino acid/polyamine antiporter, APA family
MTSLRLPRPFPISPAEVAGVGRASEAGRLGVRSGVGIVAANMIGAGVFLSAGFMAQDMGPGAILSAWAFGAILALCGARTYAAVASFVDRSGGEYRYLSQLLHPVAGYLAGWGSLALGFAAPIAIDAYAAGSFLNTLVDGPDPRFTGGALIMALALAHALKMSWSKWTQNGLVAVKGTLVVGFVALGLLAGSSAWPTWTPPHAQGTGFPWAAFMENQFWIAFAFSGWNAAIYAASDFRKPRRDVPRAMMIGCGLVAMLYMAVNWVFVANLTPGQAAAVFEHESTRITLGHLVTTAIVGPVGGKIMSAFAILALVSAMSAMTLVGPRVYAEMAKDGYLPRALAGVRGDPPVGSIVLQAGLALCLLYTHSVLQVVESASTVLLVFSGLVAVALFRVRLWPRPSERDLQKPAVLALGAAAIYVVSVVWILWCGFHHSVHLLVSVGLVTIVALAGYALTRRFRVASGATPETTDEVPFSHGG